MNQVEIMARVEFHMNNVKALLMAGKVASAKKELILLTRYIDCLPTRKEGIPRFELPLFA